MIHINKENKTPSSSTNLDPRVAGLLCYLFGWIGGLIFLLIEKEDHTVRFHALQSIFFNIAVSIIYIAISITIGIILVVTTAIPGVNLFLIFLPILYTVLFMVFFVVWIMLMVRAYRGEKWKLPIIGDIAEQNS